MPVIHVQCGLCALTSAPSCWRQASWAIFKTQWQLLVKFRGTLLHNPSLQPVSRPGLASRRYTLPASNWSTFQKTSSWRIGVRLATDIHPNHWVQHQGQQLFLLCTARCPLARRKPLLTLEHLEQLLKSLSKPPQLLCHWAVPRHKKVGTCVT